MKGFAKIIVVGFVGTGLLGLGSAVSKLAQAADDRSGGPEAIAVIHGAGTEKADHEKVKGAVRFISVADGVRVMAMIDGLTPGKHGFHIHEKNDLSAPDLSSAGGHFNPGGHKHGGPDKADHHAGDLGNLVADEKGHAHLDQVIKGLTIQGKTDGVLGHSVIIHEKEDDLATDPAGNSGKRIAGGAIELPVTKQK